MEICEWDQLEPQIGHLVERIAAGDAVSTPFPILAITDDPETQRKVAETWVKWKFPSPAAQIPSDFHPKAGKIRVGYFSADFHEHATMYLLAEVLEKHNRDDFEVVAFSFGIDSNDLMRNRAVAAVDKFVDIKRYPDNEVVRLCRSMHIDIAVDLKGYTSGSRVGMFASRVAPVQVNYLGYPGTMGSGFHDYIIADRVVAPAESMQHFSERIVWLPDSYQANDSKRAVSSTAFTRGQFGLPADSMVYCCFNNNWKITPAVFDVWMRILSRVDGSLLWLLEDNPDAARNLKREAENRGISGDRIIFAGRLPLPEHLARHRVADLFLDTLPYNAHTTASDALWAGLPLLTCAGKSFASRVAASLLSAYFMPEMITSSLASYEARAIELGNNREQLASLRARLSENRTASPLFDSASFTRHLETAYRRIHELHHSGLPPEHFAVER